MEEYSDLEVLQGIAGNNSKILNYVYEKWRPMVVKMILERHGNEENAQDVFQDAMLAIVRKLSDNNLELSCKFSTYLYSVTKKIWLQHLKSAEGKTKKVADIPDMVAEPDFQTKAQTVILNLFDHHFKSLSKACQKILRLYMNKVSIANISKIMKHKNKHYTMDRKYRCKESLSNKIYSDPLFKEIKDEYNYIKKSLR